MPHRPGLRAATCTMALALAALAALPAQAAPKIDVLHWWTSGSESKALDVLRQRFAAEGGTWTDIPVVGGAGDPAMTTLRAQAMAGTPPGAAQIKGQEIQDWAQMGVLGDLNALAAQEKWADILPPEIQKIVQAGGHYVAVPMDIHRTNWVWANPAVLARVGVSEVPKTWAEFNAVADKLKKAGIVPLAHGGQPWQDFTLFEAVALGVGGPDYYRKAFVELDPDTLRSDTTRAVFAQFRQLRGDVDKDFAGRDWNAATAMVMKGDAAMQIMGDWAKGEFLTEGKVPGRDFLCAPTPGTPGFLFLVDSFVMFKQSDAEAQAGQQLFARLALDKGVQTQFNAIKGSIPVRTDADMADFDSCALADAADLKKDGASGALLPSVAHKMAVPAAVFGAMQGTVSEFFNSRMSEDEGVARLAEAIAGAQ